MSKGPVLVGIGSRGRVDRLLRGDVRKDDLHELFFIMREESGGRGTVSEIANFRAHPIRDQGMTFHEVRDSYAYIKFFENVRRSKVMTMDLPAVAPSALRANLRRIRKARLLRDTGLNVDQARRVLEKILSRMTPTGPGRVTRIVALNPQEVAVFQCIASSVKAGPLFTDDDLFEDFCRGLQRKGLLQPSEKDALKAAKTGITLYALVSMHNRSIKLDDGDLASLSVGEDVRGRLGIFANAEVVRDPLGRGSIKIATWIFETRLPIRDYCELGVAPLTRALFVGDLEMTNDIKLGRSV